MILPFLPSCLSLVECRFSMKIWAENLPSDVSEIFDPMFAARSSDPRILGSFQAKPHLDKQRNIFKTFPQRSTTLVVVLSSSSQWPGWGCSVHWRDCLPARISYSPYSTAWTVNEVRDLMAKIRIWEDAFEKLETYRPAIYVA